MIDAQVVSADDMPEELREALASMMGSDGGRGNDIKAAVQALAQVMKEDDGVMQDIGTLTDEVHKLFNGKNSAVVAGVVINCIASLAVDMYRHHNGEAFDASDAHVFVEAVCRMSHMATDEGIKQIDAAQGGADDEST